MKRLFQLSCLILLAQLATYAQQVLPESVSSPAKPPALSAADTAVGSPYEWVGPKYPKGAKRSKVQGAVVMRLTLDEKGQVANVSVLSGDPELTEAAVRAVRQWRYARYFRDGRPVQVTTIVTINFKLTDSGHPDITAGFSGYQGPELGPVFKVGNGVSAPRANPY